MALTKADIAYNRATLKSLIIEASNKVRATADKLDRISNYDSCSPEEVAARAVEEICKLMHELKLGNIVRYGR